MPEVQIISQGMFCSAQKNYACYQCLQIVLHHIKVAHTKWRLSISIAFPAAFV